jgi:TolA-binding protein
MRRRAAILLLALLASMPARQLRADAGDDQYAVAAAHYAAQRWSLAVDEFRALLKDHPEHRNATKSRFFLAEALVQLGRYDEAQTQFRDFLARDPKSPFASQALFREGEAAFLAGRAEAARPALTEFRAKYPDDKLNAYVLNYLGQLALADGDAAAAAELFGQSLTRFPGEPPHDECRFGLARARELSGHSDEAEKLYRQLADGKDAAIAEQALLRLATLQAGNGKPDRAVEMFEAFERKYPHSQDISQARLGHARALYQGGHFAPAQALLEPLVAEAKSPDDASRQMPARYVLALAYQGSKRHADALKLLEGMAASASTQWKPKIELAQAASFIATEQFIPAATVLEAYLQTKPDGEYAARAVAQLAVCYAKSNRWDDARNAYRRLSRDGHSTVAAGNDIGKSAGGSKADDAGKSSESWLSTTHQLAEAALAAGQIHWATELYTALAADGNPPDYIVRGLSGLGWCQLESSEPEKAAATFDRLLEKYPDSQAAAEAAWARGQALERLKRFDGALASYQLIIDKDPSSKRFVEALLAAARLHDRLHQSGQAIELYQRFLADHSASPQIDAARYGFGWALRDAGRRAESDQQFQKVHDDFRASRFWNDATFRLAESAVADKRFDPAGKLLAELMAAQPPTDMLAHVIYLQGELAAGRQRWDECEARMDQVAHDFADSPLGLPAAYWVAEAEYRQGKYDSAGKRLAVLSGRVAGHNDPWLAMIPLRRAQVMAQQRQWSEAQAIALHIQRDFPNFAQQYEVDYLLGRALAAQADFEGARREYQQVIRSATGGKTETAAMAQWMIGESYFHQENYDAALREYLRVEILYAFPRWQAAALLQAGKCQELLGRRKEAAELYARLIKAYPNTEFTEEGTRRLHLIETASSTPATAGRNAPNRDATQR